MKPALTLIHGAGAKKLDLTTLPDDAPQADIAFEKAPTRGVGAPAVQQELVLLHRSEKLDMSLRDMLALFEELAYCHECEAVPADGRKVFYALRQELAQFGLGVVLSKAYKGRARRSAYFFIQDPLRFFEAFPKYSYSENHRHEVLNHLFGRNMPVSCYSVAAPGSKTGQLLNRWQLGNETPGELRDLLLAHRLPCGLTVEQAAQEMMEHAASLNIPRIAAGERELFEGSGFSVSVLYHGDENECLVKLDEPRNFLKENPSFKHYQAQLLRQPALQVSRRKPTLTLAKV